MKKPTQDPLDPESFALESAEIEPASMDILYKLIAEQVQLEETKATMELDLKELNANLRSLSENKIPTMAETLQLKKFESPDGQKVEIKDDVKATIAKNPEAKANAIAYLRKTGNDALVKEKFIIQAVDHEQGIITRKQLLKDGYQFDESLDVNTASLKAFVKKELEAGNKDFDPKTFGVFKYRRTVIK